MNQLSDAVMHFYQCWSKMLRKKYERKPNEFVCSFQLIWWAFVLLFFIFSSWVSRRCQQTNPLSHRITSKNHRFLLRLKISFWNTHRFLHRHYAIIFLQFVNVPGRNSTIHVSVVGVFFNFQFKKIRFIEKFLTNVKIINRQSSISVVVSVKMFDD